ncbi:hypothetical protein [Zoogloea sp.]|uniref:hypothetical protein n=1 Tax=Zoogloea sp. TaxID=49181 RepID=UPI0026129589|nr:hypothetical protein [Zoogloea sp.]
MDVVKYLREVARKCHLSDTADDELARLRTENEFLRATLDSADQAMAAAPIWHTQHRVLSEILIGGRRKLAELDTARAEAAAPHAQPAEKALSRH